MHGIVVNFPPFSGLFPPPPPSLFSPYEFSGHFHSFEVHLRHEVGSASAGIHNGDSAEVHLPDDGSWLGKGVVHDHVQQRLQQSTRMVKGVLCQEECKPAGMEEMS